MRNSRVGPRCHLFPTSIIKGAGGAKTRRSPAPEWKRAGARGEFSGVDLGSNPGGSETHVANLGNLPEPGYEDIDNFSISVAAYQRRQAVAVVNVNPAEGARKECGPVLEEKD